MSVSQEGILAVAYRSMVQKPRGRERRAIQSATAESLLADMLRLQVGASTSHWKLSRNHAGRPTLSSPDGPVSMRVSLSHCGPFALAAITDCGEIGVDLEVRNPKRSICEIAEYAFGAREQDVVKSDGMRAFYRIWTLREAFAKARGLGFSILADGRDYFAEAPDSGIWQATVEGDQWLFSTGDLPGDYAVSVAVAPRSPFNDDCEWDLTPRELNSSGAKTILRV
jgi:4'-phosphopantetheinyl transferase